MEQRSEQWFADRLGRLTSTLAKVVLGTGAVAQNTLIAELVAEVATTKAKDVPDTFWMRHGRETEPKAIAAYELYKGCIVADGGFKVHEDYPMCADSPDGLIGLKEGVLEVKCPAAHTHAEYLLSDKVPAKYLSQVKWHLWVSGRDWCDFVSYNEAFPVHLQFMTRRVNRADIDMDSITERVESFLKKYTDALERLELTI